MVPEDTDQPEIMPWQEHVEGLIVGALRGMAEAQAAMARASGGALPSLSQSRMFEAAELLVATLLEASPVCDKLDKRIRSSPQQAQPKSRQRLGEGAISDNRSHVKRHNCLRD